METRLYSLYPRRYPLNSRMEATSCGRNTLSTSAKSLFATKEHIHCLSQITPVVVGISKISHLLKATETVSAYQGGRKRRRVGPRSPSKETARSRLHHLDSVEHKGHAINTRVGLGRGWEAHFQGTPVDSPRRKFTIACKKF